MSENVLKENLDEFKNNIKEKWGKLSDNDINSLNGDVEQLANVLQQRLGYAKEQATTAAQEFMKGFKETSGNHGKEDNSNMKKSAGQAADKISDISKDVGKKTVEAAKNVKEEVGEYGKAMVDFIEDRPYQSIAIAGLAGLVVGLLCRKKQSK